MASIIKRKKAYSVVYNYVDERGETKQKWETCHSHKEALKRKAENRFQYPKGMATQNGCLHIKRMEKGAR